MGWRRRNDDEDKQPDRGRASRDRRGGDRDTDNDFGFVRDRTNRDAPRGGRDVGGRSADGDDGGGSNWLSRRRGDDDSPDNRPARPTGRFDTGGAQRGGTQRGSSGARSRGGGKDDDKGGGFRNRFGRGRDDDQDDNKPARSGPFVRGSADDRTPSRRGSRGRDNVPGGRSQSPIGADDSLRSSRRGSSPAGSRNLGGSSIRDRDQARPGGTPLGTAPLRDRDTGQPGSRTSPTSTYGSGTGGSSYGTSGGTGPRDRDTGQPGSRTSPTSTYGSGTGGSSYGTSGGTGPRDRDTGQPGSRTSPTSTYGSRGGTGLRDRDAAQPGSRASRSAFGDRQGGTGTQPRTYGTQTGSRSPVREDEKTAKKDEKRGSKRRLSFGRGSKDKDDKQSPRGSKRGSRGAAGGTLTRDRASQRGSSRAGTTTGTGFGRTGTDRDTGAGVRPGSSRAGTTTGTGFGRTGTDRDTGVGTRRGSSRAGAAGSATTGRRGSNRAAAGAGTAMDRRSPTGAVAPGRRGSATRGGAASRTAPRGQAKPLPGKRDKGFTVQQGLDFDRKIDIVGVVLVVFALVTFSAIIPSMSMGVLPEPASGVMFTLNEILSQLFGWGKIAIPIAAFWVGTWLIREIFEDRGIELDYFRIVGRLMLFAGALAWLHMIQLFDVVKPTVEEFQPYSRDLALASGEGGGWLGHQIYFFLLSQLLDFGTISVLVAWIIMGLMLSFDVSVVEIMAFVGGLFAFLRFTGGDRAQKRAARRMLKVDEATVERPGQSPAPGEQKGPVAKETTASRRGLRRRGKDAKQDELPLRPGGTTPAQPPGESTIQPAPTRLQRQGTSAPEPATATPPVSDSGASPSRPRINRRGAVDSDNTAPDAPSSTPHTAGEQAGAEPRARRPLPRMTPATDMETADKADAGAALAAGAAAGAAATEAANDKGGRQGLFGRRGSKPRAEASAQATSGDKTSGSPIDTAAEKRQSRGRLGQPGSDKRSTDKPAIPVPPRHTATTDTPAPADDDAADKPDADARAGTESRRLRFGRRSQPNAEASGEGTPAASTDRPNAVTSADDTPSPERRGLFGRRSRPRGADNAETTDQADDDAAAANRSPQARSTPGPTTSGADTPDRPARHLRSPRTAEKATGESDDATDTPVPGIDRARAQSPDDAPSRRFGETPAIPGNKAETAPDSSPADRFAQRVDRPRRVLTDPLATPDDANTDQNKEPDSSPRDTVAADRSEQRTGPDLGDRIKAAGAAGAIGAAAGALVAREHRAPVGTRERVAATPDTAPGAPDVPRTDGDPASVSSRLDELRKMREQHRSRPLATPESDAAGDSDAVPAKEEPEPQITRDAAPTQRASATDLMPRSHPRPVRDISDTGEMPAVRNADKAPDANPTAAQHRAAIEAPLHTDGTSAKAERPEWLQRRQSQRAAQQAQPSAVPQEKPAPEADKAAPADSPAPTETERPAQPAGIIAQRLPRTAPPEPTSDPGTTVRAPEQTPTRPAEPVAEQSERLAPPVHRRSISGRGPSAVPALPPEPATVRAAGANAPVTRAQPASARSQQFKLPDFRRLLRQGDEQRINDEILLDKARIIEDTLASFGAPGKVVEVNPGPVITQFGVEPDYLIGRGGKKIRVKVGQIARLDADLALALAAKTIRIEAPVPGKGFVGIEVPNDEVALVGLYDIMESPEFMRLDTPLKLALGLSVDGTPVAADLTAMPHLLIAGTTGSGKSVCVNSIITALLLNNTPDELQFIMVDPKRVELTGYNGIPHLVAPVVVELERIVGVLQWVQREMEERYRKFAAIAARNIVDYNKRVAETGEKMPYYIVVVDELADLMMLAPDETERLLARLAQMARATGIHLIISTQRPSVDIITGLIKANFPARIAFAVASSVDSRVILDQPGAEKLLGRGDMLFQSPDAAAPLRMQGVFVSDEEIMAITRYWKGLATDDDTAVAPVEVTPPARRDIKFNRLPNAGDASGRVPGTGSSSGMGEDGEPRSSRPAQRQLWDESISMVDEDGDGRDDLYGEAVELVQRLNKASISLLQRRLRIGYTRAARLIDIMEQEGIVGPPQDGSKPREVLKPKIESGDD